MHKEMLVLEETSTDEIRAFLVNTPVELQTITSIIIGGDATKVPILPYGIIIIKDYLENILNITMRNFS